MSYPEFNLIVGAAISIDYAMSFSKVELPKAKTVMGQKKVDVVVPSGRLPSLICIFSPEL